MPDTSVLVDGRITPLVESDYPDARILIPNAVLAELEAQANRGLETGFTGLDELQKLQAWAREEKVSLSFVGRRPTSEEIGHADTGAIDALIRDTAVEEGAVFVTSDRVQAYAAAAQGVRHHYIRPIVEREPDLTDLEIWRFFDDETMSVHLKTDCVPMVKRGTPGNVVYEPVGSKEMAHQEVRRISRECIEFAKRDYNSFIELDRKGCTVVQLGPMRITLAQPPFADAVEVTAVRPVFKATIDDYELPPEILARIEEKARGVFVAGPPGSGKSTFAAAVAEWLWQKSRVVKTMEQPRDLQVPKEVTQYGALDRDMAWTGEVMLLVRPDHVVYDEVRTTGDFQVFADMRLAGIGLFGVTHANRAIDAVQRLIGRVDLGMIPQIVDTVVYIDAGQVATILELSFTVKVPEGMTQEDLARPVVMVRDILEDKEVYELYTYGEQIVVMPLGAVAAKQSGASALAGRELERILQRRVHGRFHVDVRGNKATVYVEEWQVPKLIGQGGRTIRNLERETGMSLDVKSLADRPREAASGGAYGGPGRSARPARGAAGRPGGPGRNAAGEAPTGGAAAASGPAGSAPGSGRPVVRKTNKNVFILLGPEYGGRELEVLIEDAIVGTAVASRQGKLRFKANSPEGQAIIEADRRGLAISVR